MSREREKQILSALSAGPLKVREISEKTGLPLTTIYAYLRKLPHFIDKQEKCLYSLNLNGRKYLELLQSE